MKLKRFLGILLVMTVFLSLSVTVFADKDKTDEDVISRSEKKEKVPFGPFDSLAEIKAKIKENGYSFTVDHNWVYDMDPVEKEQFFSRRPSKVPPEMVTGIGPLADNIRSADSLPTAFDWRNVNGNSYIQPVGNQGSCGSCYSWGACAAAEGTYNVANGLYDGNCVDFSESYIIWCLGRLSEYNSHFFGCGGADYDYMELEALCNEGVTYEANFPYTQSDPGSCTHWNDPVVQFASWHRVPCNDINAIKSAIMTYGVVDAAVYVTSAFQAYSGGIYEDSSTTCGSSPCYYTPTNHAISLVGWNDNGGDGYWILRNSWGTSWGESGYMRISYQAARVACEVCYFVYEGGGPGGGCEYTEATFTSSDVPKTIPDNSSAGVNSTVYINDAGDIHQLSITVNVDHTWRGDLKLKLTSPAGTSVTFLDPSSNDSDDDVTGTYLLGDFDGEDINGTWTFNVSDHARYDTGSIQAWSLTACYEPGTAPDAPTVDSFYASPSTITDGGSATLYWSTSDANYVRINGGSNQSADGSMSVSPGSTTTYNLVAYGDGGQASASTTVTVNAAAPTVDSFYASPSTITEGDSTTLYWGTTNASYVRINGGSNQSADGSMSVSPGSTTTYSLVAYGDGGQTSASTSVTVNPAGGGTEHYRFDASDVPKNIPDNRSSGITSTISVPAGITDISGFSVYVNISHTWRGDLIVKLTSPGGETYTIHNRSGSSADNVIGTYTTSLYNGDAASGTWTLFVSDNARYDTGKINSWYIEFDGTGSGGGPGPGASEFDSTDTPISIPDYNSTGITSGIDVTYSDSANSVEIYVDISHTYIGDLKVQLITPGGTIILSDREGGSTDDIKKTYTITYGGGNPQGTWQLKVSDHARYDTGTLNGWKITF